MSSSRHPRAPLSDQPPSLVEIAEALIGVESSSSLIAGLEMLLVRLKGLPARLYMYDAEANAFYAAAGLGCDQQAPDLPWDGRSSGFPAGQHLLGSRGQPIGLLAAAPESDPLALAALAAVLGPTLLRLHGQERTMVELRESHELMAHIISAGELLRHLDLDVLLTKILEALLGAVKAQVGAVLTPDAEGRLVARVAWGLREEHLAALRMKDGRTLAAAVHADGRTLRFDAEGCARMLELRGAEVRLTGLLALPLTTRGRGHGVAVCANPDAPFGPGVQRVAETMCSLAAIALDNALLVRATIDQERLKQEMDLAHSVQNGMFPTAALAVGGLIADGMSQPASETGGDYLSYLERGGRLIALIGDVSGHGLGAALYTAMAHAIVQQQLRAGTAIEPAFRQLNDGLYHTQSGRFMTAAVVEIDPATGAIGFVSAGHNPLLLVGAQGVRWLESTGMPLGVMPDAAFEPAPAAVMEPGDILLLYTDGITEAADATSEIYGDERLAAVVRQARAEGVAPRVLIERILAEVAAFTGGRPPADDLTLVAVRRQ